MQRELTARDAASIGVTKPSAAHASRKTWFDLPLEIQLEVLKHCFLGAAVNHKHHAVGVHKSKLFSVLYVSKTFTTKKLLTAAMLSTATLKVYGTGDLRIMHKELPRDVLAQLQCIKFSQCAKAASMSLKPKLHTLRDLHPNLRSIEISVSACDSCFCSCRPRFNVSPDSDLFLLAIGASAPNGHYTTTLNHVNRRTSNWLPTSLDLFVARTRFNLETEYATGLINQEHASTLLVQAISPYVHGRPRLLNVWLPNLLVDLLHSCVRIELTVKWRLNLHITDVHHSPHLFDDQVSFPPWVLNLPPQRL